MPKNNKDIKQDDVAIVESNGEQQLTSIEQDIENLKLSLNANDNSKQQLIKVNSTFQSVLALEEKLEVFAKSTTQINDENKVILIRNEINKVKLDLNKAMIAQSNYIQKILDEITDLKATLCPIKIKLTRFNEDALQKTKKFIEIKGTFVERQSYERQNIKFSNLNDSFYKRFEKNQNAIKDTIKKSASHLEYSLNLNDGKYNVCLIASNKIADFYKILIYDYEFTSNLVNKGKDLGEQSIKDYLCFKLAKYLKEEFNNDIAIEWIF